MDLEQDALDATKKIMDSMYDYLIESDILSKAAKVTKKYAEELEKVGFSHEDAICIASKFSVGK